MKISSAFIVCFLVLAGFAPADPDNNIDLSCMKIHKASNTCHFNFKVDGARYRFVDVGCKYSGKKDEVIRKAREGSLALAREWKIECPEVK
jgi:hypothetical protein